MKIGDIKMCYFERRQLLNYYIFMNISSFAVIAKLYLSVERVRITSKTVSEKRVKKVRIKTVFTNSKEIKVPPFNVLHLIFPLIILLSQR